MSTQDLFGIKSLDLEAASEAVEATLALPFERHHSSYRGGDDDSRRLENQDEIVLQFNNEGDEGPAEEDFADFGLLLSIYSPANGDSYKALLSRGCPRFAALERSITTPSHGLRRIRYQDGKEDLTFEMQLDAV